MGRIKTISSEIGFAPNVVDLKYHCNEVYGQNNYDRKKNTLWSKWLSKYQSRMLHCFTAMHTEVMQDVVSLKFVSD